MEAYQLPFNPPNLMATMNQEPPYMGCQSLPGAVLFEFWAHPPFPEQIQAIFSTRLGTLPVRYLPEVIIPVVIRTDFWADVFFVAEHYSMEFPEAVTNIDFMPTSWESLYEYFDPYDLWVQGAEFLYHVMHRLAWHALMKKRRFDRLVSHWCSANIAKLAQLPFTGSPVKKLLDRQDWYYFNFANIPEHDIHLICRKLDRQAYDVKPEVDRYKEFHAAPTPVSPIKQGSDNAQDPAMLNGLRSAAIGSDDAQEHKRLRKPSHETHAAFPISFEGDGHLAHEKIQLPPHTDISQATVQPEVSEQSYSTSTPEQSETSHPTIGLGAPDTMRNEQSNKAGMQRAPSGYSVDETLAELKDDEAEKIPRVALPGQPLRSQAIPHPGRTFNVPALYNGYIDYNLAAEQGRLLSIRLADTYDTATLLKSDLIPRIMVACAEIESYRPSASHAEMTFYLPGNAQEAVNRFNNQSIGEYGPTLIVYLVPVFNNLPNQANAIDYNSHNVVLGRRNFSPQNAGYDQEPIGRRRVDTGGSWASTPVFTPRAGGVGTSYEHDPETMTGELRETRPVARLRHPSELMPTMQFGQPRVPSTQFGGLSAPPAPGPGFRNVSQPRGQQYRCGRGNMAPRGRATFNAPAPHSQYHGLQRNDANNWEQNPNAYGAPLPQGGRPQGVYLAQGQYDPGPASFGPRQCSATSLEPGPSRISESHVEGIRRPFESVAASSIEVPLTSEHPKSRSSILVKDIERASDASIEQGGSLPCNSAEVSGNGDKHSASAKKRADAGKRKAGEAAAAAKEEMEKLDNTIGPYNSSSSSRTTDGVSQGTLSPPTSEKSAADLKKENAAAPNVLENPKEWPPLSGKPAAHPVGERALSSMHNWSSDARRESTASIAERAKSGMTSNAPSSMAKVEQEPKSGAANTMVNSGATVVPGKKEQTQKEKEKPIVVMWNGLKLRMKNEWELEVLEEYRVGSARSSSPLKGNGKMNATVEEKVEEW